VISADAIDLAFVPLPAAGVASVELDGEIVVSAPLDATLGATHWLDPVASLVWRCFDGAASLHEIVDDLARELRADREIVGRDVLELTRTLARVGLLAGVEPERVGPSVVRTPDGLAPGELLPEFTAIALDGTHVTQDDLRGRPHLLVNWSPTCRYCRDIAGDLAAAQPALARAGIGLVLVALGDAEATRALCAEAGLTCTVLLHDDFAAFGGVGTPAAYAVDAAGRVEHGLALGSVQVPALARELGA